MTEQLLLYLPDPYGVGNSKYAVAHAGGIEVIPGGNLLTQSKRRFATM